MSAQTRSDARHHSRRLAIGLAVGYLLLAALVFALIASQPPDEGLEWMPLVWLASPWFGLSPSLLLPGILLNAGLLYVAGLGIQALLRPRDR